MTRKAPRPRRRMRLAGAVTALTVALALCGCGLEPTGSTTTGSDGLLVTQGFGGQTVLNLSAPRTTGAHTVLGLLERNASITTSDGERDVASINGLSAVTVAGQPADWFFYVNGVEGRKHASVTKLHSGDQVWFDRHDGLAAENVKAVVGSFPEPFLNGYGGTRYPTRIECIHTPNATCTDVENELASFQIAAGVGCFECSEYNESLRVLVGPYASLTEDQAADELGDAPSTSGVYARFIDGGRKLELLNASGAVVQTLGAGTGLVAATRWDGQPPVWFITGTDAAGVSEAEQAFTQGTLDGHFAVAVVNDIAQPLPLTGGRK